MIGFDTFSFFSGATFQVLEGIIALCDQIFQSAVELAFQSFDICGV